MKHKTDYIFFGLTGLLIVNTLIQSQLYGYILSVNNYLAFILWPTALILQLRFRSWRYPLAVILLLSLFNIINFQIGGVTFKLGLDISIPIETPGVNAIMLLIVIAYYFVNRKLINNRLSIIFKGTKEERKSLYQKNVDFYIKKFSACSEQELKLILADFEAYPIEAQMALRQMQADSE